MEHTRHAELLHAYTTAAVINFSQFGPEEAIPPASFMPNHRDFADKAGEYSDKPTEEQQQARAEFQARAMQLAAELKQGFGPLLEQIQDGRL